MEDIEKNIKKLEKFCRDIQAGNMKSRLRLPKKDSPFYHLFSLANNLKKMLELNSNKCSRLEDALGSSISSLVIIDKNGKITFVNKSWADIHGYKQEELINQNIKKFFPGETYIKKFIPLTKNVSKSKPVESEFEQINKNGNVFPIWVKITPLENKSGYVITARDITKLKQTERELEEKVKQLDEMNKLLIGRELKMIQLKNQIRSLKK